MPRPHAAATRRTRGSWTPRIAGISAAVLAAFAGAIIYAVASPAGTGRHDGALSGRVRSVQTVGIISQVGGAVGEASALRMLSVLARGRLVYAPIPAADLPQGNPQWTVDTMGDGTFVFIYAPSGRCLGGAGRRVTLQRCDLGAGQRWQQVRSTLQSAGGIQYAQYRNLGSGRCLATRVTGTASAPGLLACGPAGPVRQLVAFYWGVLTSD